MGTYLGQGPFKEFSSSPTKDLFTGDGSTTTFDLGNEVVGGGEFALEVFIDNVRQEPGTGKAFTLGVDGSNATKRLTFTSAPANGAYIYVINDKTNLTSVAPLQNDLNGTELVLDGDGDTSITADTDDRIDFRISDADHLYLGTSSGDTTFKIAADAKDFIFQQYDGRNVLEINDAGYVALANGATGSGELRIYEDTDNGTNYSGFKVGTQSADIDYVLPTADGSSGYRLETNGSGTLSWAAPGHVTLANSTNNRVMTSVDSTNLNSEANLTFDGSTLAVTGAATISTTLDVDGTTNLDVVDIDGAVQLDATLTIGANDQGYDVILYGDTASANVTWDTDVDDLILNGDARIVVPDGQLVLGSTAVTSTAAELNLLDGVSGLVQADLTKLAAVDATAAEINLIDGGTARGTTAVASGDGILINDGGTMRMTNVDTVSTYFASHTVGGSNIVTTGALNSGSITSGFGTINNGSSTITTSGAVATGALTVTGLTAVTGNVTATGTVEPAGDTAAGDNAAIGYTAAEGLILTGQGSTNDITIKNDADADVISIPTGGTGVTFAGIATFTGVPVLPANTIDSAHYVDGSIDLAHMSANSVDSDQYVDGSIDLVHMSANSIDSDQYVDGSIDGAHIANDAIDSQHYAAASIDNEHLADSAVNSDELAAGAVDLAHMSAESIDSDQYVDGSIDRSHLAADIVDGSKIADDSIDSEHYVDSSIDTAHIGNLQVTGGKLALDHRSSGTADDVKTGNQHDYIFFDGDVGISFFSGNAEDMRLEDDGDLHVDNDVIAFSTTISDATLKYNINPVEFALDKVNQLKGCTFNYFKDDRESAGLLAQDVERVMPSAVSEKKIPLHTGDGKAYKTLHYDSVTAILVEAIKELTAKVKRLEEK